MAVLNSKFDILRGWPDGSAIAEDFIKHSDATDKAGGVYRHGTFVALGKNNDGSATFAYGAGGAYANNKAVAGTHLGLIIEGDEETSSQMSGTVTCLVGGGYMVRLHLEGQFDQNAFGDADIPNGRDQFVATRPGNNNAGGTGLAAVGVANQADFSVAGGDPLTLQAGMPVTVIRGVICAKDSQEDAELVVGTCLKIEGDICEVLIH